MSRRFIIGAALAAALAVPAYVRAHEGHVHKVMGTVTTVGKPRLIVKATNGKSATIMLNEKTTILRGKAKATVDEIKPGERIVVTATETKGKNGKTTLIAKEIRLPEAVASK